MDTPKQVRVIAIDGFTDDQNVVHPYGQEFSEPEGARLDGWLKDGHVRIDTRGQRPAVPDPSKAGA